MFETNWERLNFCGVLSQLINKIIKIYIVRSWQLAINKIIDTLGHLFPRRKEDKSDISFHAYCHRPKHANFLKFFIISLIFSTRDTNSLFFYYRTLLLIQTVIGRIFVNTSEKLIHLFHNFLSQSVFSWLFVTMEISAVSFSRQISVKGESDRKMRWSRNAGNTLLATFEFYFRKIEF